MNYDVDYTLSHAADKRREREIVLVAFVSFKICVISSRPSEKYFWLTNGIGTAHLMMMRA